MRRIGSLHDATLAQRFCDYLITLQIEASCDPDDSQQTSWNIWVREEGDVARAREELAEYENSPHEARYQVESEAERIRRQQESEERERERMQRKAARSMSAGSASVSGALAGSRLRQQSIPVTIGILALSIIASFATNFDRMRKPLEFEVYFALSVTDPRDYANSNDPYEAVRRGEVWRVITPMFMHGDAMHLAFNMLWVFFLGSAIERLQGSLVFAALAFGSAMVGIWVQVWLSTFDNLPAALQGSPFAIGASGSVYGLFGYLWIRPLIDPEYPIRLVPMNVILMLAWLVMCMTPMIPKVANGAHLGGLLAGMAAAVLAALLAGRLTRE